MIGASGMNGDCAPTTGFVVVDSMSKDAAVDYFDMTSAESFNAMSGCWDANKDQPFTKCRSHAQKWRDVPETEEDVLERQTVRRMSADGAPACGAPPPSPTPNGPTPAPG